MTELYAIDKKNKIRVFKLEVELIGPTSPNTAYIHTYTGLLGGNLIYKKEPITVGKQKRSINQQAEFVANSTINEKLDEGYKSRDQLRDKTFIASSDIAAYYELGGIKYNTNRNWDTLPMLAEKWKDFKKKVKYPVAVQPKLNGIRCVSKWKNNKVVLLSRGGQEYIMPHIATALHDVLSKNPNLELDGELYLHGMPLQKINGIVQLEDETQFARKLPLQYHIYDLAIPILNQTQRLDLLKSGYEFDPRVISIVSTKVAFKEDEVQTYHDEFVKAGYEGAIVRDLHATYQFGFRDQCLLKVKEFIDEEFEIIGCEIDGNKGIESFVFVLKNNINDLTFKARPTGSLEYKDIWRTNINEYIGKKATIRYQERTQDGLPHQGNLRAEKTKMLVEAIRDYE